MAQFERKNIRSLFRTFLEFYIGEEKLRGKR